MTEEAREKNEGGKPAPGRPEPDPVSVPENGDFRYDQANEGPDEQEEGQETRRPRKA